MSLRSRLPEPLKKLLRPLVVLRRRWGKRRQSRRFLAAEVERLETKAERLSALHREAQEQRDAARHHIDAVRALHEEAKRQRDESRTKSRRLIAHNQRVVEETRERLRQERARSSALTRRLNAPDDDWHDQRQLLGTDVANLDDLWYYPSGVQNPYLRLLYSRCPEYGFDPRPLITIEDLSGIPATSVFHLHWTRIAQLGAETEEQARETTAAFLGPVEDFVRRGGMLMWSVHEPLPHDCPYPEVEAELRARLAELAHSIHVLHESTIEESAHLYRLDPAKTFIVEHPLYDGAYEDYTTRDAARNWLGLDDDTVMLLGFGSVRPYKGFDRAVRILPRLREATGRDVRVLICGPSPRTEDTAELHDLVAATDGADIADVGVPASAVHILFRAADLAVLPYRAVLNSGVLMLSLSFGVPTVAPRNAVTETAEGSNLLHLFEADSDDDLFSTLIAAIESGRVPPVGMPDEYRGRHSAFTIAGEFAAKLRELADEHTRTTS